MKYFSIEELTRSSTAKARGIDNTPTKRNVHYLTRLIENTLDPLRELWGKPIRVNSGYRSPALNKAIGGTSNSSHMYGYAADITTGSKEENKALWNKLVASDIPFTKAINEQDYSWIHISYIPGNISRIKLKAIKKNGRWIYMNV